MAAAQGHGRSSREPRVGLWCWWCWRCWRCWWWVAHASTRNSACRRQSRGSQRLLLRGSRKSCREKHAPACSTNRQQGNMWCLTAPPEQPLVTDSLSSSEPGPLHCGSYGIMPRRPTHTVAHDITAPDPLLGETAGTSQHLDRTAPPDPPLEEAAAGPSGVTAKSLHTNP